MDYIEIIVERDPETLYKRLDNFKNQIHAHNSRYAANDEARVTVTNTSLTIANEATERGTASVYTLIILYHSKERFYYLPEESGQDQPEKLDALHRIGGSGSSRAYSCNKNSEAAPA